MNNMLRFTKVVFNNQWNLSEEKIGTNLLNTLYKYELNQTEITDVTKQMSELIALVLKVNVKPSILHLG